MNLILSFVLALLCFETYAQEKIELQAYVKKGSISIASKDGNYKFGFGGRVFMDAAAYFDDETNLGNGSEFRDIRLLMKATIWKKWDAKINVAFAGGKVLAKDIFAQYNFSNNKHLRIGYFFEPFGLERTESSKSIKFLEIASTNEAFGPGRGLGFQYATFGKQYYWGVGLFGDKDINNSKSGDEAYGLSSRLVYAAFVNKGTALHIGVSATYRTANANGINNDGENAVKHITYRSRAATHVEARRFIDAKVWNAKNQFKYGLEILAATGSLAFQGELIGASVNRESGFKDYKASGWYGQLAFLLNGKQYKYKMSTARLAKPGPGSIELLARYNQTDLNDSNALIMGGKQNDLSLGIVYYMNHNILLKLNYVNVDIDENNAISTQAEKFSMIQTRFQIAF